MFQKSKNVKTHVLVSFKEDQVVYDVLRISKVLTEDRDEKIITGNEYKVIWMDAEIYTAKIIMQSSKDKCRSRMDFLTGKQSPIELLTNEMPSTSKASRKSAFITKSTKAIAEDNINESSLTHLREEIKTLQGCIRDRDELNTELKSTIENLNIENKRISSELVEERKRFNLIKAEIGKRFYF